MSFPSYNPYKLPNTNNYLYDNQCNNLCADPNTIINPNILANSINAIKFYDEEHGRCHDPTHNTTTDIFFQSRNPNSEIYDYLYYGQTPLFDPCITLQFIPQNLVANFVGLALNYDPNLLNSWGIVIINDTIWVANASTGFITSYDIAGKPLATLVNVYGPEGNIGSPTGIVHNKCSKGFKVIGGALSGPSTLLIATLDGTINGYNPAVDPLNSFIMVNNSIEKSVYTGLAIFDDKLYVADFYNGKIDVFDSCFNKLSKFPFIDEYSTDPIPIDYSSFNISRIGQFLFVVYAKQNPLDNQFELAGCGNGYISIFDKHGRFIKRFASKGHLNAPWGIVHIPTWFGFPVGSIFVANSGDGTILVYDECGKFLGKLKNVDMCDINIQGIKGLTESPNFCKVVYWTANCNNLVNSFVGSFAVKSSLL